MKSMKWILAAVVVLGLVLVAGGLALPSSTRVERSIVIERPPGQVFEMLDSFRRFTEWSPWSEFDPEAHYEYQGPAAGVGARMSWEGDRALGSGRQEIVESEPDRRIVVALDFNGNAARGVYALAPESGGTRVTWTVEAEYGYDPLSRWFGLLYERMIGPDLERGLARLKALLEREPA